MGNVHLHEDFSRKSEEKHSSERSFGIVFAVVFFAIGLLRFYKGSNGTVALVVAVFFTFAAFCCEQWLRPLNALWQRVGQLLFFVTNPVIMAVFFYGILTPLGFILRLVGNDPLRLNKDETAASYWIKRSPPGPLPKTMNNQF